MTDHKKADPTPDQGGSGSISDGDNVNHKSTRTSQARLHLQAVFGHGPADRWVHLYAIRPGHRPTFRGSAQPGDLDQLTEHLTDNENLYVTCTMVDADQYPGKQRNKTDNATHLTCLWVDLDRAGEPGHHPSDDDLPLWTPDDYQRLTDHLEAIGMPATVTIDSGGGWQAWWRLTEPVEIGTGHDTELLARWRLFWEQVETGYGRKVDRVWDLARIQRLAGSINLKADQPRPVQLVTCNIDNTYTVDDLDQLLPVPTPAAPTVTVTASGDSDRPGDRYNRDAEHNPQIVVDLLVRHGFHTSRRAGNKTTLVRPGKPAKDGHSVSVYRNGVTSVWSSSLTGMGLTAGDHYSPFALFAILDHRGDYSTAARQLADQNPTPTADPIPPAVEVPPVADTLSGTLDHLDAYLDRFVHFESDQARHAVTLWIAHTWCWDQLDLVAYLSIKSPEKRCGKSTLLDVLVEVVRSPLVSTNISVAAIYRLLEQAPRTLVVDEVDTIFPAKRSQTDPSKLELQGLLNGGNQRGRPVYRSVPPRFEPQAFDPFGPKVFAGIGDAIPDTVRDRSIEVSLQRKPRDLRKARNRKRIREASAAPIRSALAMLLPPLAEQLAGTYLDIPEAGDDRAEDTWEPLVAIADAAGGSWPAKARQAVNHLAAARETSEDTTRVKLLADLRDVWPEGEAAVSTDRLLTLLGDLEESPWRDWFGRGLQPRDLATLLKPFKVASGQVWDREKGNANHKGYRRDDLHAVWDRYLPAIGGEGGGPTPEQGKGGTGGTGDPIEAEKSGDSRCPIENPKRTGGTGDLEDLADMSSSENRGTGENPRSEAIYVGPVGHVPQVSDMDPPTPLDQLQQVRDRWIGTPKSSQAHRFNSDDPDELMAWCGRGLVYGDITFDDLTIDSELPRCSQCSNHKPTPF